MSLIAAILFILAICALIVLVRMKLQPTKDGFADAATTASTRQLLIDNYGTDIMWGAEPLYADIHSIQERYLNTLQKASPELDARSELERLSGVQPLKCSPQDIQMTLSSPPTPESGRAYLNCLPVPADFQILTEFLVNELKQSLSGAMNALSGNIDVPAFSPRQEGFAAFPGAPCDITSICQANTASAMKQLEQMANSRRLNASTRSYLEGIAAEGKDAIQQIDEMNTSAQDGTIPFVPPPILS